MTETSAHYDVMKNEKYGRYLVANKDLDCGEIIFTDFPFAVGPKPDNPPLCLGCYCPVESTLCPRCGWPVCGEECAASEQHAPECAVFCAAGVRFQPVDDWTASAPQLDCITPLRMLLAKEKDPDRWSREVECMETHTESRKQRPTWAADETNVVKFLNDHCKLGSRFTDDLVQKVCGILEVNSVEIPSRGGFSVRAIYPRLAIAAHSCVPNIVHSIMQDYQVQVRAAIPLKPGATLHLCYTHALSPTLHRREYLLESKFFRCDCARCADPAELGTQLSTLKCSKCDNGVLLSSDPLDNDASWKCTDRQCGFTTSGAAMRKLLAVVQAQVDALDALEPSAAQAIEQREATINKFKSVFHPRHSILLGIKHALAQLYGRVEGYNIDELPEVMLERKAEMCRLVLQTLDVVTPGDSRMRGMMLYELHAPLMFIARMEFGAGVITPEKLKEKLQEPIKCLEEAARILMREDPQSPEGITGQIAQQSMEQLKASLECL